MSTHTDTQEITRQAVETIVNTLNSFGSSEIVVDAIADELNKSHRTLQQLFIKTMVNSLRQYGRNTGVDGRNEAAFNYCKSLDEPTFPYI